MINAMYRGAARKEQRGTYRHANMKQIQHRRVQTMHLYYDAAEKYKKPMHSETGARLKYDVQELRPHPGKLGERYR